MKQVQLGKLIKNQQGTDVINIFANIKINLVENVEKILFLVAIFVLNIYKEMADQPGEKTECPFCLQNVSETNKMNCFICMRCKQKMHGVCPNPNPSSEYNQGENNEMGLHEESKKTQDIMICPVCNGNRIAYCSMPEEDINEGIKANLDVASTSGGKRKGKRKNKLSKKSKKTKKNKRTKRSKKHGKTHRR